MLASQCIASAELCDIRLGAETKRIFKMLMGMWQEAGGTNYMTSSPLNFVSLMLASSNSAYVMPESGTRTFQNSAW